MISRITIAALALAICGSLGAAVWLSWANDDLRLQNARQAASLAAFEAQAEQSRQAAEVAKANAEFQRQQAAKANDFRDIFLNGDNDAKLPDSFRDDINRLLDGL